MKGILLVNLGSPESPTAKDVKPYLDEFLMDQRVIDVPYLFRAFLVKGIILNTRPKKSAEAYKKIWWPEGSPLIVISERLTKKVQEQVDIPVELAMRYGQPSIEQGIDNLHKKGVKQILMIPLYPQYAMATTQTIEVLAKDIIAAKYPQIQLSSLPAFYNKPQYIDALASSIEKYLKTKDYDHLLFSYHGVPQRHIKKSDITKGHCKMDKSCCSTFSKAHEFCYRHQCLQTTESVAQKLGLDPNKYSNSFQSRLGPDKWLQPATDKTVNELAENGIKKLLVVTPAFVADCLETLEEIAMEAKEEFLHRGGEHFETVPCLNDNPKWVEALVEWINQWKNN
ncbi:ferrochelatase [Myroides sp. LJL115]